MSNKNTTNINNRYDNLVKKYEKIVNVNEVKSSEIQKAYENNVKKYSNYVSKYDNIETSKNMVQKINHKKDIQEIQSEEISDSNIINQLIDLQSEFSDTELEKEIEEMTHTMESLNDILADFETTQDLDIDMEYEKISLNHDEIKEVEKEIINSLPEDIDIEYEKNTQLNDQSLELIELLEQIESSEDDQEYDESTDDILKNTDNTLDEEIMESFQSEDVMHAIENEEPCEVKQKVDVILNSETAAIPKTFEDVIPNRVVNESTNEQINNEFSTVNNNVFVNETIKEVNNDEVFESRKQKIKIKKKNVNNKILKKMDKVDYAIIVLIFLAILVVIYYLTLI